jgi:hypothetical protein
MSLIVRAALLVALVLLSPRPGGGQEIEIEAKPPGARPEPRPPQMEIITPPGAREITRPRESDFYPEDIRVRLDPAFIAPFTTVRPTGPKTAVQFGLAGWTAPNTPVASQQGYLRESPGWFALGFSVISDRPVREGVPVKQGASAPAQAPR